MSVQFDHPQYDSAREPNARAMRNACLEKAIELRGMLETNVAGYEPGSAPEFALEFLEDVIDHLTPMGDKEAS